MKRHACIWLVVAALLSPLWLVKIAGAQTSYSQMDWEFSEDKDQFTDQTIITAGTGFRFVDQFVMLNVHCLVGKPSKPAFTIVAPRAFTSTTVRYRFDELPGKTANVRAGGKPNVLLVDGAAAVDFLKSARTAKSVLVEYAYPPETKAVRYDLSGFMVGAADIYKACAAALK